MAPEDRARSRLRVVVAVSKDRSDLYFANELLRRVHVVGVLVENQTGEPEQVPAFRKLLRIASKPLELPHRVTQSFSRRFLEKSAIYNRPEYRTDFGEFGLSLQPVADCPVKYTIGMNRINAQEYVTWLRDLQPDLMVVCGTSLLRGEMLKVPRLGILNLHGGLSQRYRGLNTTDWAVHNGEPEYVGATVHFVSPGIDDGDVVYQGRPKLERTDTPNDLYVKVVRLGVNMMQTAIEDLESNRLRSVQLEQRGPLFLGSQFTHRVRMKTWRRFREGVVGEYLDNKSMRDAAVDKIIRNDFQAREVKR